LYKSKDVSKRLLRHGVDNLSTFQLEIAVPYCFRVNSHFLVKVTQSRGLKSGTPIVFGICE